MPASRTERVDAQSATSFGSGGYTPAAFTPTAGNYLVVIAQSMSDAGAVDTGAAMTIADSQSMAWTKIGDVGDAAAWGLGIAAWISPAVPASVSTTITIDAGANFIYDYFVFCDEIAGGDGTTAGYVEDTTAVLDGAETLTLAATPTVDDICYGASFVDCDSAMTPSAGSGATVEFTRADPGGGGDGAVVVNENLTSTSFDLFTDRRTTAVTTFKGVSMAFIVKGTGGGAPAVPVSQYLTPTLVADRGSISNVTSATTSVVDLAAGGSIKAGNYLIARVAINNSGTNGAAISCTVADTRSNTWTVGTGANADPGLVNEGSTCRICYCKVVNQYIDGDDVTFTWGAATTAKSIVIEEWSGINRTTPVATAQATATTASTNPSVSRTPTRAGQLVYGALSVEGPTGDGLTADADTTEGSWVTLTRLSTSDATATNNQTINGAYKINTGTSAQTWNPTMGTARDAGEVLIVFDSQFAYAPPNVFQSPSRRWYPKMLAERPPR